MLQIFTAIPIPPKKKFQYSYPLGKSTSSWNETIISLHCCLPESCSVGLLKSEDAPQLSTGELVPFDCVAKIETILFFVAPALSINTHAPYIRMYASSQSFRCPWIFEFSRISMWCVELRGSFVKLSVSNSSAPPRPCLYIANRMTTSCWPTLNVKI